MLVIETRYVGPTNTRGSRVVARVMEKLPTRKVTLEWNDAIGSVENHHAAAVALIRKLGWTSAEGYGNWIEGASERGYVFVCDTKHGNNRLTIADETEQPA